MKRLDDETKEQIVKLYKAGTQPKEIGEKFGIASGSVVRIMRKKGIERTNLVRLSKQTMDIIVERYEEGVSSEVIAKDLGINGSSVINALRRRKITIRPSSRNSSKPATK